MGPADFYFSMGAVFLAGMVAYVSREGRARYRTKQLRYTLWAVILATAGYILCALGLIPSLLALERLPAEWRTPAISLAFGLLSLVSLLWDRGD